MFVWLRRQGFESSINKVCQKEKLVNSKTIKIYSPLKKVSLTGANLVQARYLTGENLKVVWAEFSTLS